MKKLIGILVIAALCISPLLGLTINTWIISMGPPIQMVIDVINDSEPPVEITDFHFSVDMPCQIIEAEGPAGWTLRYALPNSFVEMDADPGAEIPSGGMGSFFLVLDGPCEDVNYTLYFTGPDGVIPGSERSGPLSGLNIDDNVLPEDFDVQISPNPFNSACVITAPANASIEIYDLQGRLIESYECGCAKTEMVWQPKSDLGSGIYLVKIRAKEFTFEKRAIYLK